MLKQTYVLDVTTLKAALIGLTFGVVGIGLVSTANLQYFVRHPGLQSTLRSLSGFLVVTGMIAYLWHVFGKKVFLKEIMAEVRLSENVRQAGILQAGMDYLKDIEWEEMLPKTKELDLLICYGHSWRHANTKALHELAKHSCQVRIVLPNPDDPLLMSHLASQFQRGDADELKKEIIYARKAFDDIFGSSKVNYHVWYLREHPHFSYYRMDDVAVISVDGHQCPHENPPFVEVASHGPLYKFFAADFKFLISGNEERGIESPAILAESTPSLAHGAHSNVGPGSDTQSMPAKRMECLR